MLERRKAKVPCIPVKLPCIPSGLGVVGLVVWQLEMSLGSRTDRV